MDDGHGHGNGVGGQELDGRFFGIMLENANRTTRRFEEREKERQLRNIF